MTQAPQGQLQAKADSGLSDKDGGTAETPHEVLGVVPISNRSVPPLRSCWCVTQARSSGSPPRVADWTYFAISDAPGASIVTSFLPGRSRTARSNTGLPIT